MDGMDERLPLTKDEYVAMLPLYAQKVADGLNALYADRLPPGMTFFYGPADEVDSARPSDPR